MPESPSSTPTPESTQPNTPQLNAAEKEVVKFVDAVIDRKPEEMRPLMTDSFQQSYNFDQLNVEKQKYVPTSFRILRSSKEAAGLSVQVEVLYQHAKSHKQRTKQVEYSLIKDSTSSKLLINEENALKADKPFYKKPLFWVLTALGVLLLAGLAYYGLVFRKTTANQAVIKSGWHTMAQGASDVDGAAANATKDESSFNTYSTKLNDYKGVISDVQYKANQLKATPTDQNDLNNYKTALSAMNDYITEAASQSTNVAGISSSDSSKLQDLADVAQKASDNFQNNAKFLGDQMPSGIFDINNVLQAQKEKLDKAKADEQAAADAAAAAAAQDKVNKAAVDTTVTAFQQGFITGNASAMRPYMTTGFQGEYNFNQLNPDQRQYQYPSSFRIINTTKQPDGTYKSQVNVLFKYTDSADQYTQGYEYSVINQSNKWLINNEKISNSF